MWWVTLEEALRALGFPKGTVPDGAQERSLVSVMALYPHRNAALVSQILMKSPTWSGPICAVSFTRERQEWKPLWKLENSPVAFGCHAETSHGQTISQPPPTFLSLWLPLVLWLLQSMPKNPNPTTVPVPTNLGETSCKYYSSEKKN